MINIKAYSHLSIFLVYCLIFCCSAYSQIKVDSLYFPLAIGNQWIYNSVFDSYVDTETVVDTQRVNGKLYYGLAINSSSPRFWLHKDSNKVFIAPTLTIQPDTTDIKEEMIYDFLANVNDQWSVLLSFNDPGIDCDYDGDIILTSKEDTVVTSLGIYRNCFTFMHSSACADAGRSSEWFARGVGRVFYYQENIWGANGFSLTKFNLITSVSDQNYLQPINTFHLLQNYPNPFNPSTTISFSLPSKSFVSLKIFNLLGREVATLFSEEMSAGSYSRQWNAANMSSGIYFYRLQAGIFTETKKLVLLR